MREILFRGRTISTGEWVEGGIMKTFHPNYDHKSEDDFYNRTPNCYCICANCKDYFVEQKTIGQYTGLTDNNGTKIFEGDIVKAFVIYNERFQDSVKKVKAVYEIKYHEKYCYFYLARKNINVLFDGNWNYGVVGYEVVGNIHDNKLEDFENGC